LPQALLVGAPSALTAIVPVPGSMMDADEDERTCGVCLDEGDLDFIAVQPCGHKICCDCARELLNLHPHQPVPCP
jgi:hypothetical protein